MVGIPAEDVVSLVTLVTSSEEDKPLRLAPVVPAPPWWNAASILGNSQLKCVKTHD